jgi:hypothetical protein
MEVRQATWCGWESRDVRRGPGRDMAIRIEALTAGDVPFESWSRDPRVAEDSSASCDAEWKAARPHHERISTRRKGGDMNSSTKLTETIEAFVSALRERDLIGGREVENLRETLCDAIDHGFRIVEIDCESAIAPLAGEKRHWMRSESEALAQCVAFVHRERAAQGLADCAATPTNAPSAQDLTPMRRLAGLLAMRADAAAGSIANRAAAEIARLRTFETSPPTDVQLEALDAQLDRTSRDHELTIATVTRVRALLRGLRDELSFLEREVTRSHRYRLEMEALTGE